MSEVIGRYKAAGERSPEMMWAWPLYGAGLDNLGQNHRPVRLPVPLPGPYQLLARIDAVGLCFSDVKLIRAGGDHPRLYGRDLAADPTIPGHEVSLTIVDVGEQLGHRFHVGQRFVVQADIYYHGVNLAYGYMLRGGLGQYSRLGEEILNGDAGCYLIPIQAEIGYAESALTEPWACIEASYRIRYRQGLKQDGTALFLGSGDGVEYSLSGDARPVTVLLCEVPESFEALLRRRWEDEGTVFVPVEEQDVTVVSRRETQGNGLDDIVLLGSGSVSPSRFQDLAGCLALGGTLNLVSAELARVGAERDSLSVGLDVGRIHYDDIKIVGCAGPDVAEGYGANTRAELRPRGRAWFLGAGGPMGQMQVQRALEMPDGPRTVLASNLRSGRIESLARRFGPYARQRNMEFVCLTRAEVGEDAYLAELGRLAGEGGFDDIVVLAPSHRAVEEAAPYLAEDGVMNMFAGMPRGTLSQVSLGKLLARRGRIIGSSGSSIRDLEYTLRKAERGDLRPNGSVAAVAGIEGVWEGMQAVAEGRFPGKIVIYPQIEGLELTPLGDLQSVLSQVAERMEDGIWTREAEGELLRRQGP
jgi:D-arabinose 1-dehydrogenase-like Zn-dependent alcohol dehydrogenase